MVNKVTGLTFNIDFTTVLFQSVQLFWTLFVCDSQRQNRILGLPSIILTCNGFDNKIMFGENEGVDIIMLAISINYIAS